MQTDIGRYQWVEVASAPTGPGIYVWYCSPHISDFDMREQIAKLKLLGETAPEKAVEAVQSFLEERIFSYFREDPYEVMMRGPLKPSYSGKVQHDVEVSNSLAKHIVEDPERILFVRDLLTRSVPIFASPLYIGMSKDIRTRLLQHKSTIERFRGGARGAKAKEVDSLSSFAMQVVKRKIQPDRLSVFTLMVDHCDESDVAIIESLLNRMYYPILGRN